MSKESREKSQPVTIQSHQLTHTQINSNEGTELGDLLFCLKVVIQMLMSPSYR
jgi:hypothetical protein